MKHLLQFEPPSGSNSNRCFVFSFIYKVLQSFLVFAQTGQKTITDENGEANIKKQCFRTPMSVLQITFLMLIYYKTPLLSLPESCIRSLRADVFRYKKVCIFQLLL